MTLSGITKLAKLREFMSNIHVDNGFVNGIQAAIIGSEDSHHSEYIMDHDKRRHYISGFQGSYGTAIITATEAVLWTDGRYYTQATEEFDPHEAWTLMKEGTVGTPTKEEWLISVLPPRSVIGVDPNLISNFLWETLHNALSAAGHCLMPLQENLIDKIWGTDQPQRIFKSIVPHLIKYSGKTSGEKVAECRKAMNENHVIALVVSALDEIAYLLNLRGSDIPYCPVFFSYVIITVTELHMFVNESKLIPEAKQQLKNEGVEIFYHPYEDIKLFLNLLIQSDLFVTKSAESGKIWITNDTNHALHAECRDVRKFIAITPVRKMQIVKNFVEIKRMKEAHIRDAVALVKYFAWLEVKVKSKFHPPITEMTGAEQLEKFRREQKNFVGLSFSTISSVGPHAAIIHYLPSPQTDSPITDQEIYLCDSGAQYYDGTTDVTRTLHFGTPTSFQREAFTRVFKGQTALASAIFPTMIKGNYLDTLARKSLWDVGLNYLHGTGHGIGAYLNVHEFPCSISWRPHPDDPGLQLGMVFSNEPGFYENESFGVRLENAQCIVEASTPYNQENLKYLAFETITFVPIQTSLLDITFLSNEEIEYLNTYHVKCLEILRPFLQGEHNAQALQWLEKETLPISKNSEEL